MEFQNIFSSYFGCWFIMCSFAIIRWNSFPFSTFLRAAVEAAAARDKQHFLCCYVLVQIIDENLKKEQRFSWLSIRYGHWKAFLSRLFRHLSAVWFDAFNFISRILREIPQHIYNERSFLWLPSQMNPRIMLLIPAGNASITCRVEIATKRSATTQCPWSHVGENVRQSGTLRAQLIISRFDSWNWWLKRCTFTRVHKPSVISGVKLQLNIRSVNIVVRNWVRVEVNWQ